MGKGRQAVPIFSAHLGAHFSLNKIHHAVIPTVGRDLVHLECYRKGRQAVPISVPIPA